MGAAALSDDKPTGYATREVRRGLVVAKDHAPQPGRIRFHVNVLSSLPPHGSMDIARKLPNVIRLR